LINKKVGKLGEKRGDGVFYLLVFLTFFTALIFFYIFIPNLLLVLCLSFLSVLLIIFIFGFLLHLIVLPYYLLKREDKEPYYYNREYTLEDVRDPKKRE